MFFSLYTILALRGYSQETKNALTENKVYFFPSQWPFHIGVACAFIFFKRNRFRAQLSPIKCSVFGMFKGIAAIPQLSRECINVKINSQQIRQ